MATKVKTSATEGSEGATGESGTDSGDTVEQKLEKAMSRESDEGAEGDEDEGEGESGEEGAEGAESGSEGEDGEGEGSDDEPDQLKPGEIKGLNEQAQQAVNKRIAKITKARKAAEEKATELEAELTGLRGKLDGDFEATVKKLALHGDYVSKDDAKVIERYEKLREHKRWLSKHRGGFTGKGTDDSPEFTPDMISDREAEVDDELMDISGKARSLWDATVKQIREDLAAGRKARSEAAKTGKEKANGERKPPVKHPPRIPSNGDGARKPPVSANRTGKATFDKEEFTKAGGGKTALENQFSKIFGADAP
jgi:hypothetical protein